MRKTVEILGIKIDKQTQQEALETAKGFLKTPETSMIFTPNAEILVAASKDEEYFNILNSADLCTPDGIGVVYGSKILKDPIAERVAGYDLGVSLLEYCAKSGDGVFFFGSKPGVAEKAKAELENKMPGINIVGTRNGYFKDEDTPEIIEEINNSGAKLLLVCLGFPKQEKWIYANREKLSAHLCMGLGGALDVLAGEVKRAPDFYIKCNIEWLYRLCKQPSRFKRYGALPKFIKMVFDEKKAKGI